MIDSMRPKMSAVQIALQVWLLAMFVLVLLGNAMSDIWLTVTSIIFLAYAISQKEWAWVNQRWVQIVLVFWGWMLLSSLLSQWPEKSIAEAVTWIRFPLFAAGLPILLGSHPRNERIFLFSMVSAVVIMCATLGVEKFINPEATRLYGTWGQNTKAGWLVLGFGLPLSYWLLGKAAEDIRKSVWVLPSVGVMLAFAFLTGEVFITISFVFGLVIYLFASRIKWKWLLAIVAAGVGAGLVLLLLRPELAQRFLEALNSRLPWLPSSDYYQPWMRGLKMGELNLLLGVGPHNYGPFCDSSAIVKEMFEDKCYAHPHQMYIQVFAETGVVGLLLFAAMGIAMIYQVVKGTAFRSLSRGQIAAICLIVVVLWPIATYSHAFGQHKNFFTWVSIAWAFVIARKTIAPAHENTK